MLARLHWLSADKVRLPRSTGTKWNDAMTGEATSAGITSASRNENRDPGSRWARHGLALNRGCQASCAVRRAARGKTQASTQSRLAVRGRLPSSH